MILVVFHTAGINEKKNNYHEKKKFWYRTWMGYCSSELKAGLGAGLGVLALGTQARQRRHGRAGVGRMGAGAVGAGAAGAGARWEWQAWASGAQASARGAAQHGAQAAGLARARQGAAGARTRHGRAGARGRRRQGRAGRPAGRPVRAWCAQLGQVWCFAAPDSVFGLVRLGIFPESPNEHCSL